MASISVPMTVIACAKAEVQSVAVGRPPRLRRIQAAWLALGAAYLVAHVAAARIDTTCEEVAEVRYASAAEALDRLFVLTEARLALMESVAAWKRSHGTAIADPGREVLVLDELLAAAAELGLEPEPARHWFELQIGWARTVQQQWFERWHAGATPPASIADLAGSIRPELDRIGHEMLVAAYLGQAEIERPQFHERYRPQARAALRRLDQPAAPEDLLAALAALRTAETPALGRIAASGVLRIGTTGDYRPFSYEADGRLRGIDIDLGLALAQALDVDARFIPTSWPELMQDLEASRFDVALSGITRTDERARVASFSLPYYRGGKTAITRCGEEARFDTLVEIDSPGVRVIVNPGGTNERFVRSRLVRARVLVHTDNRTVFEEILLGRADVMITDDIEVEIERDERPGLCRSTPETFTQDAKGILLPQDAAFLARVDAWLATASATGLVARTFRCHLPPSSCRDLPTTVGSCRRNAPEPAR